MMSKNRTVGKRSLSQYFEDDSERLSMTRLLCFLSFWPASYVVIATTSHEALGWYLGAYVGGYTGGKWADAWKRRGKDAVPDR